MISKEMLSSAANAHRSAILTSAVLALPRNSAITHIALAVQTLAQGLTAPNKVAARPLQTGTSYSVFSAFCGGYARSAPIQSWTQCGQFHDSHKAWRSLITPMHKPYIHIA